MKSISRIILASLVVLALGCVKIRMTPDPEPELPVDATPIPIEDNTIYTYNLSNSHTPGCYDECVAASTLQGLLNRQGPVVYLYGANTNKTTIWIDMFSKPGNWLEGKQKVHLETFGDLLRLGKNLIKSI